MAQCPSAGRAWQGTVGSRPVASTAFRTCPLCEATCGLEMTLEGDELVKVRGDADDVFSHGFICPKGASIKALHEDPDRLRTPLLGARRLVAPATLGRGVRA